MTVIGRRSTESGCAKDCGAGRAAGAGRSAARRLGRGKLRYRPQESSAVAERDAEFLEVAVGEIGEHVEIDPVLPERLLVSAEPETAEPHADIHDRALAPEATPDPLVNDG